MLIIDEESCNDILEILSFKSNIILCADFKPIPFTDFIDSISLVNIDLCSLSGFKEDKITCAVFGPTPETDIKSLKIERSS